MTQLHDFLIYWSSMFLLITVFISAIMIMLFFAYTAYDVFLKRLMGWDKPQVRSDVLYFIKHKEKIRKYIEAKKQETKE